MMKTLMILCALGSLCVTGALPSEQRYVHLLGSKECTWGPSYWCSNLTAAAGCHATKHCIQTVWPHKTFPEDKDSICQTCLDMVKQARDQLECNETQEEIKEVFEGSCKLIPIKLVSAECCKLADDFIPDLIDTLASEMNPQTVCSVAGLCNNIKYDTLLETATKDLIIKNEPEVELDKCQGCHHVMDIMEKKFSSTSRDDFLQKLLQICGRMGSFSDSCTNIVISYFNGIYAHMQKEFTSDKICLLSGECSVNFHVHPEIEVTPLANVGIVSLGTDDPACKLCKQLVGHLRDLLIADTTETEFQKVLQGLCKQTGNFKDECLGIVNQYYPAIYKYLVEELNSTIVCDFAGICPGPGFEQFDAAPIAPLLHPENMEKVKQLMRPAPKFEEQPIELMQLPIERLGSPIVDIVYNKQLCTFCQYFLHYVQQAMTDPNTEGHLKDIVDKACEKLPNSVTETCVEFVNSYGDAVVAILAQEIDPATVCPAIRVCPASDTTDIEVFMQGTPNDKPNCPLCLFAVTKLEEMVKDHKTKETIKNALQNLCVHLNTNLRKECQDLVDSYTDELIEMLVDDFTPQEICVYLKICKDNYPHQKIAIDNFYKGSVSTNEIPDFTANGKPVRTNEKKNKPSCPLCEFVMTKLQDQLKDHKTEEEIEEAIHSVCKMLPQTLRKDCDNFVNKYGDMVFQLLIATVEPKEICIMIHLCDKVNLEPKQPPKLLTSNGDDTKSLGNVQCFLCKQVIKVLESVIGSITEDELEDTVKNICSIMPQKQRKGCDQFIDKYGDMIYNILKDGTQPGEICMLLLVCSENPVAGLKDNIYTCAICDTIVSLIEDMLSNPNMVHSAEHVLEKVCSAMSPKHKSKCESLIEKYGDQIFNYISHIGSANVCKEIGVCHAKAHVMQKREMLVGGDKCTWGPSYWCESTNNAKECGDGAHNHCKSKVWKADKPAGEV